MIEGTILLVGCGKMGGALLRGWFAQGLSPVDIMVVEPAGRAGVETADQHPALSVLSDASELPSDFRPDAIVFAVKPQAAVDIIPSYARFAQSGAVYLSIIAGLTVAKMESLLGSHSSVVRAMPNTPAAIGQGISALYPGERAGPTQKRVCKVLMAAVGETVWLSSEDQMDGVTAVSGSGPAYVFLLAECLAQAGVEAGLSTELAEKLACHTVSGAGALLHASDLSASELRENVTSPNGTTAAALDVLRSENGLSRLMTQAVLAAAQRSKDLAS